MGAGGVQQARNQVPTAETTQPLQVAEGSLSCNMQRTPAVRFQFLPIFSHFFKFFNKNLTFLGNLKQNKNKK